eukprot:TRINITY_DN7192_c0_g1_i1.p1 TRINITY_DN7192_c0_g1~~TRINITY_DN7192_c0_g1_i1.p1  ORF type:complete len:688 (-),score=147.30 TRINITY_DN7192_c0_g1_i1:102-2165(-)
MSFELDSRCINTIRLFSADMVQKANSGHPGAPMGMAPVAHVLWTEFMRYNPHNPDWFNRDRFVLSNGHACALLYTLLHFTGYESVPFAEIEKFRQVDSKTPGHPERHLTKGVEVSTGPLGQGLANAVGLAIGQAHFAARFNKPEYDLINNYTYVFCGDGCLQEGITSEACSLAGHLGLGNLILIYDDNRITIDGKTELSFTEDVEARFKSYGWHTVVVEKGDGTDEKELNDIRAAIDLCRKVKDRPSIIKLHTTIGFGSEKAGTEHVHGSPLGADILKKVKRDFGFQENEFFVVPREVRGVYDEVKKRGAEHEKGWNELFAKYKHSFPDLGKELERRIKGGLPDGWETALLKYEPSGKDKSTRLLSQECIVRIERILPDFLGGSADLNPSTFSYLNSSYDFQKPGVLTSGKQGDYGGRNIRYGVREHAMAAISNGLDAYGGIIPYCSTFLNFIQYALGGVRLSALSQHGVIYIMTHDSIGLGEDGPTHQPIGAFANVRAMPGIIDLRPSDENETAGAYFVAIKERHKPSVLALTRQNVPQLPGTSAREVEKGAYVIIESDGKPDLIFIGTGSETHLCVGAAKALSGELKVRVVSMPSMRLFSEQPAAYKERVLGTDVPILSVEALTTFGWAAYSHAHHGLDGFGTSGPAPKVFVKYGFTVENIAKKGKELVQFYKGKHVPNLVEKPF